MTWLPRILCLMSLVLSVHAGRLSAQEPLAGMDDYIREGMEQWRVPGLAIAVVKGGKTVATRAYGVRQLGQDSPVTTETVFPIASCTKSFTACTVALLVDEGRIGWDDPLRNHFREFAVADKTVSEQLTFRDVLCHRSGLVRGDLLGMTGNFTREEMLGQLRFLPLAQPFRTKVTYNSVLFSVLAEIVQRKSGKTWEDFVQTRLLDPLEMKSTAIDAARVPAERLATRHRFYDGELGPLRTPATDRMSPAGGIHSTVGDMARWVTFHLRDGTSAERQLVTASAMREMHSLQQSIPVPAVPGGRVYDARFVGTGLGWYVRDYRGRKVVQHGGAWGAEMAFVPDDDLAVVVLSNRDWNGLVWMLVFDVIDAFTVGPEEAWSKGDKWEFFQRLGGPSAMDRPLKEQRAQLEKSRNPAKPPSLPLAAFAGTFNSRFYGDLHVTLKESRLNVRFGTYAAPLEHWEENAFYGRAVVEPFLDWLVKFEVDGQQVQGLEFINVGWKDADERFVFTRRAD